MSEISVWQDDLVSIIMPAYNSSAFIADSIRSVLQQTYSKWELIIIDDCSSEPIAPIIQSFQDDRIHYIRLIQNSGVAAARNVGISKAKGRYIAFLDSDDIWLKNKLREQLQFMKTFHIGFSYTHYRQFKDKMCAPGKEIQTRDFVDYHNLLHGNDIACLTVMIDRKMFPHIEMPKVYHEDYVTWLNLLKQGQQAYSLHKDLARYRKTASSLTGSKWISMKWTWEVYRNTQCLSIIKSSYCFLFYAINGFYKHYINNLLRKNVNNN